METNVIAGVFVTVWASDIDLIWVRSRLYGYEIYWKLKVYQRRRYTSCVVRNQLVTIAPTNTFTSMHFGVHVCKERTTLWKS